MKKLWLKFEYDGEMRREPVEKEEIIVGRHSAADLTIADGRLSREHLKINHYGDLFFAADMGSSNGTTLNGEKLVVPLALSEGDRLDLGGGIEMTVEFEEAFDEAATPAAAAATPEQAVETTAGAGNAPVAAAGAGIPKIFFIAAPLIGLFFVIFVVGAMFLFSNGNKPAVTDTDDIYTSGDDFPAPKERDSPVDIKPSSSRDSSPSNTSVSNSSINIPATPKVSTEMARVEQNSAAFMRKIAQNDPTAFLTSEQVQAVNAKIKSVTTSALADNLNTAKKNSAAIRALAVQKNLKPEYLAVAAITKLGGQRGDVLATAQAMADTLDKLGVQIGNELGEDSLLMIAAYEQGKAGDFLRMRNMLQQLSNQFPQSTREIRTIWFLNKNGKITAAEYDFALRFLAIGTVSQNPKDFNVNAEALTF